MDAMWIWSVPLVWSKNIDKITFRSRSRSPQLLSRRPLTEAEH